MYVNVEVIQDVSNDVNDINGVIKKDAHMEVYQDDSNENIKIVQIYVNNVF